MDPLELQFRHALLRDPGDAAALAAFADWLRERGRDAEAETWLSRRLPATAGDRGAARELSRCRLAPGAWDKRFIRDVAAQLWEACPPRPAARLSLRQLHHLYRLVWRYRRQVAGDPARLPEVEAFLTRAGWFLPEPAKPPKSAQPSPFADVAP
jgi:uncharacterized protein (TIGR02996 family)